MRLKARPAKVAWTERDTLSATPLQRALASASCSAVATLLTQRGLRRSSFYAGFWINVTVGSLGLWVVVLLFVPRESYGWRAAPYFVFSGVVGTAPTFSQQQILRGSRLGPTRREFSARRSRAPTRSRSRGARELDARDHRGSTGLHPSDRDRSAQRVRKQGLDPRSTQTSIRHRSPRSRTIGRCRVHDDAGALSDVESSLKSIALRSFILLSSHATPKAYRSVKSATDRLHLDPYAPLREPRTTA